MKLFAYVASHNKKMNVNVYAVQLPHCFDDVFPCDLSVGRWSADTKYTSKAITLQQCTIFFCKHEGLCAAMANAI